MTNLSNIVEYKINFNLWKLMETHKTRKSDIKYITSVMYSLLKRRAIKRQIPYLSKDDFILFSRSDESLKLLIEEWQKRGFERKYSPTVDRIIPNLGYVIGNIQFLSLTDNVIKGNAERTYIKGRATNKKRIELRKDLELLIFESGKAACEFLNVDRTRVYTSIKSGSPINGWKASYA